MPVAAAPAQAGEKKAEQQGAKGDDKVLVKKQPEGKIPKALSEIRKEAINTCADASESGPLIDILLSKLQAFVLDTAMMANKGTLAVPPPDRGLDSLHMVWDVKEGKGKSAEETRTYRVLCD